MPAMKDIDHTEVKQRLEDVGFKDVVVDASPVTGSPYDYVYAYLSDKRHDGPHVIISAAEEFGERGVLAGYHKTFEQRGYVRRYDTLDEAIERVKHYAQRAQAKG